MQWQGTVVEVVGGTTNENGTRRDGTRVPRGGIPTTPTHRASPRAEYAPPSVENHSVATRNFDTRVS
jgi:hypothetical protein